MSNSFINEFDGNFSGISLDFSSFAKRLRKVNLSASSLATSDDQNLLRTALIAVRAAEQEIAEQKTRINQLENLAITDETTGLLNRRGFHREMSRALSSAKRKSKKGVLVICDLDGFKSVNDTHGHAAGDEVLVRVADLLNENVRLSDSVARLGGDEFAILMMDTSVSKAKERATELSRLVNSLIVEWQGQEIGVKASFGLVPLEADMTAAELYKQADAEMYQHKRQREKTPSEKITA